MLESYLQGIILGACKKSNPKEFKSRLLSLLETINLTKNE